MSHRCLTDLFRFGFGGDVKQARNVGLFRACLCVEVAINW